MARAYTGGVSSGDGPRLRRFALGELDEDERAALEIELDAHPSLRRALVAELRELEEPSITRVDRPLGAADTPEPRTPRSADAPARLRLGDAIGQGGMGTVRQGVQLSLGRPVAVKVLRRETPSGTHRLLQEARVTARLQHPNIVPVHEISEGPSGELQVILKRVEGELWASVMHDAPTLRRLYGAEDVLDWNLGVLVTICNALAYAHERGVIHRDVKPSNVMVGSFGEVYLLDWGIAAAFGERTEDDVAHVDDAPVAGSPAYMAPEQLEGDPDALGPWTDTYLLGATLYEVLCARPPHGDARGRARPTNVRERKVTPLASDAPRELVAIVEQALAVDLEERILTPQEFRGRLESFRSHRGSMLLAERAEQSRRLARDVLRTPASRSASDRHLTEAELGFRAALEAWPDNPLARTGARELTIHRIEAALADGHLEIARQQLATLADPPPPLAKRVDLASATENEERKQAGDAAWHQDRTVGAGLRGALVALFAPIWVLAWLALAIWPAATPAPILWFLLTFLGAGTVAVLSRGPAVLVNRINRANLLGTGLVVLASAAWTFTADRLGLGVAAAQLGILLLLALGLALVGGMVDARGLPPAVWTFACFLVALAAPALAARALAASAVGLAVSVTAFNILLVRRMRAEGRGTRLSSNRSASDGSRARGAP